MWGVGPKAGDRRGGWQAQVGDGPGPSKGPPIPPGHRPWWIPKRRTPAPQRHLWAVSFHPTGESLASAPLTRRRGGKPFPGYKTTEGWGSRGSRTGDGASMQRAGLRSLCVMQQWLSRPWRSNATKESHGKWENDNMSAWKMQWWLGQRRDKLNTINYPGVTGFQTGVNGGNVCGLMAGSRVVSSRWSPRSQPQPTQSPAATAAQ